MKYLVTAEEKSLTFFTTIIEADSQQEAFDLARNQDFEYWDEGTSEATFRVGTVEEQENA
jgi:hypothetical protein